MEWSFFVTEEALKRLQPNGPRDEEGLLLAFDRNRSAIYTAAMKPSGESVKALTSLGRSISKAAPRPVRLVHMAAEFRLSKIPRRFCASIGISGTKMTRPMNVAQGFSAIG